MTSSKVPVVQTLMAPQEAVSSLCRSLSESLVTAEVPGHLRGFALAQDHLDQACNGDWSELEDVSPLGRANLGAAVETATVVAKGVESMAREMIAYGRALADYAVGTTGEALKARSLDQAMGLQADFVQRVFESHLEQHAKLSDMGVAIAKDSLGPFQRRVWILKERTLDPLFA